MPEKADKQIQNTRMDKQKDRILKKENRTIPPIDLIPNPHPLPPTNIRHERRRHAHFRHKLEIINS